MTTQAAPQTTSATVTDPVPPEIRSRFPAGSRFVDLYGDPRGAHIYDDIGYSNTAEIYEILTTLRRRPGPVLELAAGSGRITIPLLRAHHDVTAVDLSSDMLTILRERVSALDPSSGRCDIRCADMVEFARSATGFDSVVIATTSSSLLDAAQRVEMFTGIRSALATDGVLLVSTVDAAPDTSAPTDDDGHLDVSTVTGLSGAHYRMLEWWPAGADARHLAVTRIDTPDDAGTTGSGDVHLSRVGVVPVATLADELRTAGLEIRRERTIRDTAGTRHRYVLLEAVPS